MVKTGKKISLKVLWPHLFPMGSYLLLSLVFDVLIISIFTFIHFSLSHPLPQIEEWLIEHSWEVVLLGKIVALFCSFKAVSSRPDWPQKWSSLIFFKDWPSLEVVAGSLGGILVLFLVSGADFQYHFHPYRLEASLGMFLFLAIDLLWFRLLLRVSQSKYPLSAIQGIVLALCLAFCNYLKRPYLQSINLTLFIHFVFSLNLKKDSDVAAYLLLFLVPVHALFLGDYAFGEKSAFFELKNSHLLAIGLSALLGFYWKHSNIWPRHIDDFPANSDNSI